MSLIPPTYFEDYYRREGQINNTIVKLVQFENTYYLSETDMDLGAVHVHGLLKKSSGMKEDINVMAKTWKVSQVKLTFNNLPFVVNTSGVKQRLSDLLFNIRGSKAIIYLQAGKDIPTDIETNCLERFKGIVALEPAYDDEHLIIQLTDKMVFDDIVIPNTIMSSIYADTPSKYANDPIPLVYGKFTISGDDTSDFDYTGKGLAIGVPTEIAFPPKCVIADHVLNAITRMLLGLDGFDDPAIYDSPTLTADDSSRGTATPGATAKAYMYASDNDDTDYSSAAYANPIDPENAWDRDDATFAKLYDSYDDNEVMIAEAVFRIVSGDTFLNLFYERGSYLNIQGNLTVFAGWMSFIHYIRVYFEGIDGSGSCTLMNITADGTWQTASGSVLTPTALTPDRYEAIRVSVSVDYPIEADGVADNFTPGVVQLYGLRARLLFRPGNFTTPAENQSAGRIAPDHRGAIYIPASPAATPMILKTIEALDTSIFVACEGLKYDSDITGRSSNYADGDVIEDPAGIIEWLLRTQLSYVDADIDLTSFIDAENTSVKMRMNLHKANRANIQTVIKKICEQSTFTFFMSAAGKAKLIPLNDQWPTTARIIKFSQLIKGKLKISKLSSIVETLNVNSRYQQEYGGTFRDYDTYTNTRADGVIYDADWPNIAGASAQHVARHLIKKIDGSDSNSDGLWANEHFQIEVETFGFINCDLQVGDWIELEAASFDDQLQAVFLTAASWDGQQFLITKVIQKLDSTYIKAIHLFYDM